MSADEPTTVEVDRELLVAIHAALEKDVQNAPLTRRVNVALHPIPEEPTLREKVMAAMNASETWGAACDAAIATMFDAVVRLPHPQSHTSVVSDARAFLDGAERMHLAVLDLFNPPRNIDE